MARNAGPQKPEENQPPETSDRGARESIWSILSKYKGWYFGLFSGQMVIAVIWLAQRAIADESLPGVTDKILSVWQNLAPVAISSAAIALALTDIWGTVMVFASWLEETLEKRKQRQIKAAEDRGLARGRAELQREWLEWNQRREAAAAVGEEFTEPPPGTSQPESSSTSDE